MLIITGAGLGLYDLKKPLNQRRQTSLRLSEEQFEDLERIREFEQAVRDAAGVKVTVSTHDVLMHAIDVLRLTYWKEWADHKGPPKNDADRVRLAKRAVDIRLKKKSADSEH